MANIFAQFAQPVKSVQEYDDERDARKALQTRNALQALSLQQQTDVAGQAAKKRNALEQVMATMRPGATDDERADAFAANPYTMDVADQLRKSALERRKTEADIGKTGADTGKTQFETSEGKRKAAIQQVTALNSPEEAIGLLNEQVKAGAIPMQYATALERMVRTDPKWQLRLVLGISDPKEMQAALMPHMTAAGGALVNTNPLAGPTGQGQPNAVPITQSADNAATNQRLAADAAAARRQANQHFEAGQNTPQYMQTDAGLIALPKKVAPGQQPTATVITGPDGQSLGKPLKDIPTGANTAIITNAQNLSTAKQALALLEGSEVGAMKGDKSATGLKGYLWQGILNRADASGIDTRAMLADLGSMVIHDRSGAAVTAAESPRLMPFIPLITDNADTATKKLKRFIQVYEQEQQAFSDTYSRDQGFRPSPVQPGSPTVTTPAGGGALPPDIAAIMKKHGKPGAQ